MLDMQTGPRGPMRGKGVTDMGFTKHGAGDILPPQPNLEPEDENETENDENETEGDE